MLSFYFQRDIYIPYIRPWSSLKNIYIYMSAPELGPSGTAVPFGGQSTCNLNGFSPKRDCCTERVILTLVSRPVGIFPDFFSG